ncbi:MAG: tetratricopeptide (TPR) repeat protein [Verrucomicrobiales bacterium]|jgi:tetratricopeptide (TPR) repeat protein
MTRIFTLLLCFTSLVVQLSAQQLPEPTEDFIPRIFRYTEDSAHGIYDKDVKAGWNETTSGWVIAEDGKAVYRYADYDETTGLYFNRRQTNTWKLEVEFSAEPPFYLESERIVETARGFTQETRIVRDRESEDIRYIATIDDGTSKRVVEIEGDGSLMTFRNWKAAEHLVASEAEPGTRIQNHYLDTDELRIKESTIEIRGIVSEAGEIPRYEVGFIDEKMGVYLIGEVDIDGDWHRYRYVGGMNWEIEDKETVREGLGNYVFDDLWILPTDRPLGNATAAVELVAEIDGDWTEIAQSTDLQSVVYNSERNITEIRVGPDAGQAEAVSDEERIEELRPTAGIPADDPEIVALAKEIVGSVEDQWEQATLICAWISRTIDYQIDLDPLSLIDTLRVKRGDCSEYSDLFAALARSLDLPTRRVSGWVYMGDYDQAFGYHAWNEVAIDGFWKSIDSTWCETSLSATHIKMDTSEADSKFTAELREGETVLRILDFETDEGVRRAALDQLIEKYPEEAAWYADRGGLAVLEEDYSAAQQDYKKAIELAPEVAEYRYDYSGVLESMGKANGAVKQLRKAANLSPGHPEYWATLGFVLSELEEFEEAANAYSKAIENQPHNSEHFYSRSYVWRSAGEAEKAMEDIDEALRLAPDDASNLNSKGLIYFDLTGENDLAEEAFSRAVEAAPEESVYAENLAQARHFQGKFKPALKGLREAVSIHRESPDLFNRMGLILMDISSFSSAEDAFEEALCIAPDDVDYIGNLAYALQLQRRFDSALDVVNRALLTHEEDPWILNRKGLIHFAEGDYAAAKKVFTAIMEIYPEAPLFVRNRADARLYAGDVDGAMKDAKIALKLAGDDEEELRIVRELISRIETIEISQ